MKKQMTNGSQSAITKATLVRCVFEWVSAALLALLSSFVLIAVTEPSGVKKNKKNNVPQCGTMLINSPSEYHTV